MTAPIGHAQIEGICNGIDFAKLPAKSQENVYRIALLRQRQFDLATLLITYIPRDFPTQHSYKIGEEWCHLTLGGSPIQNPSEEDWKLEDIVSRVTLTLTLPQPCHTHKVIWEASAETGTIAVQVSDIQVGLMAITINAAKGQAADATEGMKRVKDLVEQLIGSQASLNLSKADANSLRSIGNVLTFLREKGTVLEPTSDLAQEMQQVEELLDKVKPALPPKPARPQDTPPASPPAPQPGRSKLRPFLGLVGLLAAAGLAYKAYQAGLFTRIWRPA